MGIDVGSSGSIKITHTWIIFIIVNQHLVRIGRVDRQIERQKTVYATFSASGTPFEAATYGVWVEVSDCWFLIFDFHFRVTAFGLSCFWFLGSGSDFSISVLGVKGVTTWNGVACVCVCVCERERKCV